MLKKIIFIFLVMILLASIPSAGLAGNWWDKFGKPQYGGTITIRATGDFPQFDSFIQRGSDTLEGLWLSPLMMHDWTLDREIWPYNCTWTPNKHLVGCLVEDWKIIDLQTIIFHIKKGIHWQDKAPVNGREFTAYDVEYHFHRAFGMGSGFTEPKAMYMGAYWKFLESVTATDKYTVVFKYSEPSLQNPDGPGAFGYLASNRPVPKEVIDKYGDTTDWHNAVGTGAWILEKFVSGSGATLVANPNYFRFDERYPENRLPYAEKLKIAVIPDTPTAIAALRSGQVDIVENIHWASAASLAKTNPKLQQYTRPEGINALYMRLDREPFTDLRVRKALQMAINIREIATGYYNGLDPTIYGKGQATHVNAGWTLPFDKWPKGTKEGYTYNPDGAKALLAKAAADGVFKPNKKGGFDTNVETPSNQDTQLLQIIQSYFSDIGVNMEIITYEDTVAQSRFAEGKHQQFYFPLGFTPAGGSRDPNSLANEFHSSWFLNWTFNNDAVYDAMVKEFLASTDDVARKAMFKKIDDYLTSRFTWIAIGPLVSNYSMCQPYLKGFMGEAFPRLTWVGYYPEAFWIDQSLKSSMGR